MNVILDALLRRLGLVAAAQAGEELLRMAGAALPFKAGLQPVAPKRWARRKGGK